MTHEHPTKVIFRTFLHTHEVIALFPEEPASSNPDECLSYLRVGQHGAADYSYVISQSRPATHQELAPLHNELSLIGYVLHTRHRATLKMRSNCIYNIVDG